MYRYFGVVLNKTSIQVGFFFQPKKIGELESEYFPTKGNAFNPSNPWLRSAYSALGAVVVFFFGVKVCLGVSPEGWGSIRNCKFF